MEGFGSPRPTGDASEDKTSRVAERNSAYTVPSDMTLHIKTHDIPEIDTTLHVKTHDTPEVEEFADTTPNDADDNPNLRDHDELVRVAMTAPALSEVGWRLTFDADRHWAYINSHREARISALHICTCLASIVVAFLYGQLALEGHRSTAADGRPIALIQLVAGSIFICGLIAEVLWFCHRNKPERGILMYQAMVALLCGTYVVIGVVWVINVVQFEMDETLPAEELIHLGGMNCWIATTFPLLCGVLFIMPFWVNLIGVAIFVSNIIISDFHPSRNDIVGRMVPVGAGLLSIMALYILDKSQRTAFLSQLENIRLLVTRLDAEELLKQAEHEKQCHEQQCAAEQQLRTVELEAFTTVQHAVKRTMLNSIYWAERIQDTVLPVLPESEATLKLADISKGLLADNQRGVYACKMYIIQKQIKMGTYVAASHPCHIGDMLRTTFGDKPNMKIEIDVSVPDVIMLDVLLLFLVLDNAISNAAMHGLCHGPLELMVAVVRRKLLIVLINQPGPKHEENTSLQQTRGSNFLLEAADIDSAVEQQIGNADSTFCGMREMREVCQLIKTQPSIQFHPERVTFSIELELSAPSELQAESLPEGMVFICADDDFAARAGYKGLIRVTKADAESSIILGSKFEEATELTQTVLEAAERVPLHLLVCIFDQNMDYQEGTVLGTSMVQQLRANNFRGLIFIRSGNDDFESLKHYRAAGATGQLPKDLRISEVAIELNLQYHRALRDGLL